MPRIFIDPGHGGRDPGAVANGMRESDIVLEVADWLGKKLTKSGHEVQYSRMEDVSVPIDARWRAANGWGADYLVSIHANAGGGTGAETFINAQKPNDADFARAVNDTYCEAMGLRNRGVKLDSRTRHGSLGVLRHSRMPAILVELAFIDSPNSNPDTFILQNRRYEMAQALADGLLLFLGTQEVPTVENGFLPGHEPSPWHRDAWAWGMENDITDGTNPQGQPTREQVVQLMYNRELDSK